MSTQLSRRNFLKTGVALAAGGGLMLSGTAPVFAAPSRTISVSPQQKALVFIMLDGGNDSFNMLVPTSSAHYNEYNATRSNLALKKDSLLPLNGTTDGRTFGLHSSMPEVQQLFNSNKLSFVANIAPMIEPVTKASYENNSAKLPLGLLSHSDQFKHWQTSQPGKRLNQGWFGYIADAVQPNRALTQIPMNVSLAGSNIMQNGVKSSQYSITEKGSVGLVVNETKSPLNTALLNSFEKLLAENYVGDPFKQTYLSMTREAQAQHEKFRQSTENISVGNHFSDTPLSQQLRKVAQSIKAASSLNHKQQTYFLRYIGWDHHDELLKSQAKMLGILSKALGEFQTALNSMGLEDQVVTFTGSDFGRTLTSNGNGTDHGWGGNTIVMGSKVDGGKIFGSYPGLGLGNQNPLDIGNGVIIPTTATDQLYAELALWMGVSQADLPELFPNLNNFKHGNDSPLKGLVSA